MSSCISKFWSNTLHLSFKLANNLKIITVKIKNSYIKKYYSIKMTNNAKKLIFLKTLVLCNMIIYC